MAWLDDSPVIHADEREFDIPASNTGYPLKQNIGKLRFFNRFPIFKILFEWYQAHTLSRLLHKKLNVIETKIASSCFEEVGAATSLLRELMQIKKILAAGLHPPFNTLVKKLLERNKKLKKYLIQKSYLVLGEVDTLKISTQTQSLESSHQQILSLIGSKNPETSLRVQHVPSRVYWRQNPYIYLHTSCKRLVQLLSQKTCIALLASSEDIKVCHQEFMVEDNRLVCGVSLRLSPIVKSHQEENSARFTFWQQQTNHLTPRIISELNGQHLKELVREIFFRTSDHYHDFKDLLLANQEIDLLALIASLEAQQQIIIHHPDSPSTESSSFSANKR